MREYTRYQRLNTQDTDTKLSPSNNNNNNWRSHDNISTVVELTSQGSVASESPSENSETSTTSGSDEEFSDARSICSTDSYYISTNGNSDCVVDDQSEYTTHAQDDEGVEDSSRILATLQLHLEGEKETLGLAETKRRQQINFLNDVEALSIEELRGLKERLEDHIFNVNMELVEELKTRDSLYSQHQALLMEAEDASNIGNSCQHEVERSSPQLDDSSSSVVRKQEKKRWSLWW